MTEFERKLIEILQDIQRTLFNFKESFNPDKCPIPNCNCHLRNNDTDDDGA